MAKARLSSKAAPPLDLSLGHIGTTRSAQRALKPVVTREDCFDWLTEDELQTEVWAALRGARRYFLEEDFHAASVESGGAGLREGTVLDLADGRPQVDRGAFLDMLMELIYWRVAALAEKRGVTGSENPALPMGEEGQTIRERMEAHAWASYIGGEVKTYRFKSKREAQAFLAVNGGKA